LKFRITETVLNQTTDCGVWEGTNEQAALDALAKSVGYKDFDDALQSDWSAATFKATPLTDETTD